MMPKDRLMEKKAEWGTPEKEAEITERFKQINILETEISRFQLIISTQNAFKTKRDTCPLCKREIDIKKLQEEQINRFKEVNKLHGYKYYVDY